MQKRSRQRRSRRRNAISTVATLRPVENGLRIIQWATDNATTNYTLENTYINGRSWKVSSFEFTFTAATPVRVEITLYGSEESVSTKDLSIGMTPVVFKYRTPRRADYLFTPSTSTDNPTVFVINASGPVSFVGIARVTLKPRRDETIESNARALAAPPCVGREV